MRYCKFIVLPVVFCLFGLLLQAQQKSKLPDALNNDSLRREMLKQKKVVAAKFAKIKLQVIVTKAAGKTFGYFILADGNIIIDQKSIPAVPGNNGFISEEEAMRTGNFAIKKLREGEMPPTITVGELKKLKITINQPTN